MRRHDILYMLALTTAMVCLIAGPGAAFAQPEPADPPPEPLESPPAEDPGAEPAPLPDDSADATVIAGAAEPWSFGVAARVGLTIPTSKLGPTVIGGIEIDWALPVLDGRLVAALDISLAQPGYDDTTTDPRIGGDANYEIDETELKVALLGIYRLFGPGEKLIPYGGIGPVLHMLRTAETSDLAPGENTSQNTEVGVELLAGVDFSVGPGYLTGELRFVFSDLDHLFTGDSNAGNVAPSVGYRLVF